MTKKLDVSSISNELSASSFFRKPEQNQRTSRKVAKSPNGQIAKSPNGQTANLPNDQKTKWPKDQMAKRPIRQMTKLKYEHLPQTGQKRIHRGFDILENQLFALKQIKLVRESQGQKCRIGDLSIEAFELLVKREERKK